MAARPVASGTISFGLVSVPVKLYTATQSKNLSFKLLHAQDHSRVRQQYVCTKCEKIVQRDDMVRGYEYAKGQFAILTEEELASLQRQTDQSIEIEEFVPISLVDPIYFENSYYVGPDKGGHKPYRLLCEAMARTGQCAVAKFATRGRQQLVLIRVSNGGLILHALYYADEVRDVSEVDRGDAITLKSNEVELAVKLIEQLKSDSFDAAKYEDEYRKAALEVIDRKVAGQEVVTAPTTAPRAQVIDLMEALRASLGAKRKPARTAARSEQPEERLTAEAAAASGGARRPLARADHSKARAASPVRRAKSK